MATSSAAGAALGAATASHPGHSQQSLDRSNFRQREDSRTRRAARRNSQSSVSAIPPSDAPTSPVRVKMHMHNDSGGHVTLQRLPDDETSTFAASSAARRAERRQQRRVRHNSDLSSGLESDATPGAASRRYRRKGANSNDGTIRASSQQPIINVPPPPMSSVVGSHRPPSELNLPPPPRVPAHSNSPQSVGLSPSGMSGAVGSPPGALGYGTETGTGTDVSAFDSNRRRRRAERARRQQGARVEFE